MHLFDEGKLYGDRMLACDDKDGVVTYHDLEDFSEEFYQHIGKRSLVFILCDNTIGCLLGYLGCLKTGVVPLLLESRMNQELFTELIKKYHPTFLYVPEICLNKAQTCEVIWRIHGYCLCRRTEKAPPELYGELALLLPTSGSTGSPKLVRQSYKNMEANAVSIVDYLDISDNERPITTLPMNYTYGLSIINSHVLKGASIIMTTSGILERKFWDFAKRKRATSFGGVPYTYQMLKRIGFTDMDLPDLKTMTQAGGKLPLNLHKEYAAYAKRTGKQLFIMYGQTEATARMGYLPAEKAIEKCGSMGIAIPGGRFWLMDEKSKEITLSEGQGELVYQGDNVALGYANCAEDLMKPDEWAGVLHTGDMARRDADGYYYITGRKKRFIKIYGNRINLDKVEQLLKQQFEGMDFVCVGIDDKLGIFTDSKEGTEELIKEYLYEMTGLHSKVIDVWFISLIPKSESGKTLYRELEGRLSINR